MRVASVLLVALAITLPAAPGQEDDKQPARVAAGPVVRQVYAVRGGAAKELANALTLHFQAEPAFRAVPDAGSNTLLLSGPKAALDDALAALREIDRPARSVHVEVLCLELAAKAGGEAGKDAKPLDVGELSGTAREVRAKIRDLQQRGVISTIKIVELAALTGQSARTQVSESRPYVVGISGFGGGRGGVGGGAGVTSRNIAYRNVGTSVQVRPEIGADGQITLDLHVEDSAMRAAEGGVAVGSDDKGAAVPATEFVTSTLETRVKVPSGQIVLAEGSKAGSKAGQAQTVILVTASTDEPNPKGGK
jgi:hypothetical protein